MIIIKTEAYFRDQDISDDMFESFSEEQRIAATHLTPFRFCPYEVFAYNKASNGQGVTIRFKNGYDIIVNMNLAEVDRYFDNLLSK